MCRIFDFESFRVKLITSLHADRRPSARNASQTFTDDSDGFLIFTCLHTLNDSIRSMSVSRRVTVAQ